MITSGNKAGNRNVSDGDGRSTRRGWDHTVRQTVPAGGSGDWEGSAADGWQFNGQYQQTIGPSTVEGTPTRQIGDTNQLTQVWWRSFMIGLEYWVSADTKVIEWYLYQPILSPIPRWYCICPLQLGMCLYKTTQLVVLYVFECTLVTSCHKGITGWSK